MDVGEARGGCDEGSVDGMGVGFAVVADAFGRERATQASDGGDRRDAVKSFKRAGVVEGEIAGQILVA